jgi:L-ascorbate metabolism protein UlaG (beta-lactamase superfamily)
MYITLFILVLLAIAILIFLRQPKFGKLPSGERLAKIKSSPNYRNGSFQNESATPSFTEGANFFSVLKEFIFEKKPSSKPKDKIPSVKTDLLSVDLNKDVLVWFGHSSYFIQVDGKRILVDPVFSGHASPLSFTTNAFIGTDIYSTDDIPPIDYLFISHDHWDHFDYDTIKKLKPKVKKIITGLGTGEHLEYWGYAGENIIERDWNEQVVLDDGFIVNTVPARHFSGRGFKRNAALWTSFVLQTPSMKIFIGGDSGFDKHFESAGKNFGPFDLVILENGQYDKSWKYIHMMPEEVLRVAKELQAKKLLAVHSSKFAIANHAWDEPLSKISELNKLYNVSLITPMIGEQVNLKEDTQIFTEWWKGID